MNKLASVGDIICYINPKSSNLYFHLIIEICDTKYLTECLNKEIQNTGDFNFNTPHAIIKNPRLVKILL